MSYLYKHLIMVRTQSNSKHLKKYDALKNSLKECQGSLQS